jgi:hypothetical protein
MIISFKHICISIFVGVILILSYIKIFNSKVLEQDPLNTFLIITGVFTSVIISVFTVYYLNDKREKRKKEQGKLLSRGKIFINLYNTQQLV